MSEYADKIMDEFMVEKVITQAGINRKGRMPEVLWKVVQTKARRRGSDEIDPCSKRKMRNRSPPYPPLSTTTTSPTAAITEIATRPAYRSSCPTCRNTSPCTLGAHSRRGQLRAQDITIRLAARCALKEGRARTGEPQPESEPAREHAGVVPKLACGVHHERSGLLHAKSIGTCLASSRSSLTLPAPAYFTRSRLSTSAILGSFQGLSEHSRALPCVSLLCSQ